MDRYQMACFSTKATKSSASSKNSYVPEDICRDTCRNGDFIKCNLLSLCRERLHKRVNQKRLSQ